MPTTALLSQIRVIIVTAQMEVAWLQFTLIQEPFLPIIRTTTYLITIQINRHKATPGTTLIDLK